jgi:hypothetical protein
MQYLPYIIVRPFADIVYFKPFRFVFTVAACVTRPFGSLFGSGANMNSHVNIDKKCSGKYEDHRNEIIIRIIQMEAF